MPNPEAPRIDRSKKDEKRPPAQPNQPTIEVPMPQPPKNETDGTNNPKRGAETIDMSGDGTPDARDKFGAGGTTIDI